MYSIAITRGDHVITVSGDTPDSVLWLHENLDRSNVQDRPVIDEDMLRKLGSVNKGSSVSFVCDRSRTGVVLGWDERRNAWEVKLDDGKIILAEQSQMELLVNRGGI